MERHRDPDAARPTEPDPAAPPAPRATVSRRQALRLFGMAAVAVTPLPLVRPGLDDLLSDGRPVGEDPDAPAEDPSEARLRRWAMVIDLRRCDGCQSVGLPPQCTAACIEGHFVPRPMEWIEVFEEELGDDPAAGTGFMPVPCQQCQNPPCTNVCPVGATFSTPEGIVLIDQDRCIGCRICMAACPYDRRMFNWGSAPTPPEAQLADYSPEHQVPARRGTVMKCDFCPDMARAGRLPYCAQGCPQSAIYYGDLEEGLATNGEEVVDLARFAALNNATRLKEDLGTEPRVYYIPGHGELAGRDPTTTERLPTEWKWQLRAEKASWQR
jgi:molybdopterin-containing oxidoreductase family iron-sulfur binding subunit